MRVQFKVWIKSLALISTLFVFSSSAIAFEITAPKGSSKSIIKVNRLHGETDRSELSALIHFVQNPESINFNKPLSNLNRTRDLPVFSKDQALIAALPKASTQLVKNLPQDPLPPLRKTIEVRVVDHFVNAQAPVYRIETIEVDADPNTSTAGSAR